VYCETEVTVVLIFPYSSSFENLCIGHKSSCFIHSKRI